LAAPPVDRRSAATGGHPTLAINLGPGRDDGIRQAPEGAAGDRGGLFAMPALLPMKPSAQS
jgi:hypothetical protein